MAAPYPERRIDAVAGIEARGFILGGAVADRLGCGFIPIRKKGKLPWKTIGQQYQLEYGVDIIEIHDDAIKPGERILIVDDLIATGGTAEAAAKLITPLGRARRRRGVRHRSARSRRARPVAQATASARTRSWPSRDTDASLSRRKRAIGERDCMTSEPLPPDKMPRRWSASRHGARPRASRRLSGVRGAGPGDPRPVGASVRRVVRAVMRRLRPRRDDPRAHGAPRCPDSG